MVGALTVATLASMSDHERERGGGGLAVIVLAGFLVVLLLADGSGVAWLFVRQAEQARRNAEMQRALAETALRGAAVAAQKAAASQRAIEIPAPSAPKMPPPKQ